MSGKRTRLAISWDRPSSYSTAARSGSSMSSHWLQCSLCIHRLLPPLRRQVRSASACAWRISGPLLPRGSSCGVQPHGWTTSAISQTSTEGRCATLPWSRCSWPRKKMGHWEQDRHGEVCKLSNGLLPHSFQVTHLQSIKQQNEIHQWNEIHWNQIKWNQYQYQNEIKSNQIKPKQSTNL